MPPIWFCLDCERVAYGWAPGGSCIYCDGPNVVGTEGATYKGEPPTDYRLVFLPRSQWTQLEAEAILKDTSVRELLVEREGAPVERIRDEPVQHGKLVLLRTSSERAKVS